MWRSKSPRRVNRASHKSQACGRSWACVFKCAFNEPGFIMRWQDRHSILAPSPSPTTMVRTWMRPSPSSSNSSKSSAFYNDAKRQKKSLYMKSLKMECSTLTVGTIKLLLAVIFFFLAGGEWLTCSSSFSNFHSKSLS